MAADSDEKVVFRDYPVWLWLIAILTIVVGIAVPDTNWERILFAGGGIVLGGLSPVLTVAVNRENRTLNVYYRSLFRASRRVFPFDEIAFVEVCEDRERERMYRLELGLVSGEVICLRSYHTTGRARKKRRAERILAEIRAVDGNGRVSESVIKVVQ